MATRGAFHWGIWRGQLDFLSLWCESPARSCPKDAEPDEQAVLDAALGPVPSRQGDRHWLRTAISVMA